MIKILQTKNETLVPIEQITDGAWINVVNPNEKEMAQLLSLGIPNDFITYPLDLDERSRTEKDDGYTLYFVAHPILSKLGRKIFPILRSLWVLFLMINISLPSAVMKMI